MMPNLTTLQQYNKNESKQNMGIKYYDQIEAVLIHVVHFISNPTNVNFEQMILAILATPVQAEGEIWTNRTAHVGNTSLRTWHIV